MTPSFRNLLWIAISVAVVAAGCQRPAVAPLTPEELEQVRAVGQAYQKAINAEDVNGIVAVFAEDGVSLPPGWEPLQGRDAIQRFWEGQVTGIAGTGSHTPIDVYGEGGLAYDVGTYTYTFTDQAGVEQTRHGKYVGVFKRQADGSWKIAADIWNLTPPASAAKTASPSNQ